MSFRAEAEIHRRDLHGRARHLRGSVVKGSTVAQLCEAFVRRRERDVPVADASPVRKLMEDGVWLTDERPVAPHIKTLAKKIRERNR